MRRYGIPGAMPVVLVLLCLSFLGCDLLNNKPEIDLEKAIDDEIAWANAARLTVAIAIPEGWGSSNPPGGTITSLDIRRGFSFDLEFSPSAAYAFLGWRAYRTSALPANWTDAPGVSLAEVEQLEAGAVSVKAVEGDKSAITINITDPVTLIPWCRNEPRIIRTDPPLDVQGGAYGQLKTITIYFAAPLNETTAATFGEDYITIQAQKIGQDGQVTGPSFDVCGLGDPRDKHFKDPEYDNNLRTITIKPADAPPPVDHEIRVTIGRGIKSALSANGMTEPVSFIYRTRRVSDSVINWWKAAYDPAANTISISYDNSIPTAERRGAFYTINGGATLRTNITEDLGGKQFTIHNVPRLDTGGIRNGMPVSNTAAYQIFLEMYTGNEVTGIEGPIRIWNIDTPGSGAPGPGMIVDINNPAVEIRTPEEFETIATGAVPSNKTYVLVNNITLDTNWAPVGVSDQNSFRDRFYGNGHTIIVNGDPANAEHTGIFGYVEGAEIRDLSVYYVTTVSAGGNATHIGGLAGYAGGGTRIENCMVKSANSNVVLSKTDASVESFMGGIAGHMETEVSITNCLAALNVKLTTTGTLYLGGVAGSIGTAAGGRKGDVYVSGVEVSGNVEASGGTVFVGGLAGQSFTRGKMEDVRVSGEVKMSGADEVYCGGLIAAMIEGDLTRCDFAGKLTLPEYSSGKDTRVGGLVASVGTIILNGGTVPNSANIAITDCTVEGDISIIENGDKGLSLGGVVGRAEGAGTTTITFTNCEYRNGSITVDKQQRQKPDGAPAVVGAHVGGFGGDVVKNVVFDNCRVLAREIKAILHSGNVGGFNALVRSDMDGCYTDTPLNVTFTGPAGPDGIYAGAGGFAAYYTDNQGEPPDGGWVIENCYAKGPVTVSAPRAFYAGGFVAMIGAEEMNDGPINANIKNCYALGDVVAVRTGATGDPGELARSVYAGGFVGYMNIDTNRSVEKCFSAGTVIAKDIHSSSTGNVYAGGFLGYKKGGGSLKNCAALGGSVTAQGGDSQTARRVYADRYCSSGAGSNNYALSTMVVEEDSDYETYSPTLWTIASGPATPDGESVSASAIRTSYFWINELDFNLTSPPAWDLSYIRTYPRLANVGGQ